MTYTLDKIRKGISIIVEEQMRKAILATDFELLTRVEKADGLEDEIFENFESLF